MCIVLYCIDETVLKQLLSGQLANDLYDVLYTTSHGLSIQLSTSVNGYRLSLCVFLLSSDLHLVLVYDVLLYVCERMYTPCTCNHS